jgi:HPt (histidine-containing phosphotransfer) domain-containing protein
MGNLETIDGGPLPIDLEHLSQYTANDPALTRDVLQIYRDQAARWLADLEGAADLKAWKDAAHTLKGASRGVGATEVAHLAEEAEALAELQGPGREDLYTRIEHAVTRAVRYAAQLLEDSPFVG